MLASFVQSVVASLAKESAFPEKYYIFNHGQIEFWRIPIN